MKRKLEQRIRKIVVVRELAMKIEDEIWQEKIRPDR